MNPRITDRDLLVPYTERGVRVAAWWKQASASSKGAMLDVASLLPGDDRLMKAAHYVRCARGDARRAAGLVKAAVARAGARECDPEVISVEVDDDDDDIHRADMMGDADPDEYEEDYP